MTLKKLLCCQKVKKAKVIRMSLMIKPTKTWRKEKMNKRSRKMKVKRISSVSKKKEIGLAWLESKDVKAKQSKKLAGRSGVSSQMEIAKTKSGFCRRKKGKEGKGLL